MKKSDKSTKTRSARSLSSTIRKPVAPPGHPLSQAKPEARAHPAGRTAKHKRPPAKEGDE